MPIPYLGSEHLTGSIDNKTFEPQRQNNGILLLPNLPEKIGAVPYSEYDALFTDVPTDDNLITLSVESFPLPADSSNIIEIPWNNEKRKFAGSTVVDDVDVTIRHSVDPNIAGMLQAWRSIVHNAITGRVGWAKWYKTEAYFLLYPPDADSKFQTCYKCLGVFPSRFARGDIDHGADDVVRIIMTLSIDKVMPVKVGSNAFDNANSADWMPKSLDILDGELVTRF